MRKDFFSWKELPPLVNPNRFRFRGYSRSNGFIRLWFSHEIVSILTVPFKIPSYICSGVCVFSILRVACTYIIDRVLPYFLQRFFCMYIFASLCIHVYLPPLIYFPFCLTQHFFLSMGVGGLGLGLIFDFNVGFTMGIFSSAVYLCFRLLGGGAWCLAFVPADINSYLFFSLFCLRKTSRKQLIGLLASLFPGFFVADGWGLLFFLHPAASAVAIFVCSIRLWVGERREEGWTSLLIELVEGRWWEFGGGGEMCQSG